MIKHQKIQLCIDWVGDINIRKSTTGWIYHLNGLVAWLSRKHSTVVIVATEAEFIAFYSATKEITWLRSCRLKLFSKFQKPIYCDN